jgi:hypothetical protein
MRRAILIASSDFPADSGIERLRFPVNDVNAMETTLSGADFGFEVRKIINENNLAVMEQLEAWISKADYEDLVLIYFSGHGKLNRARELFLSCANTKESSLNATALKYKWIMDVVNDHSLQRVAVILDCCYAGRAIAGSRGTARGAIEEQVRTAVTEGHGHFFLGASGANQTAEERELDGHGRFTKQILEGLSSGDADIDGDGNISAKDLSSYVKRELRRQNASQEPIEGGGYQGELILGSNRRRQLKAAVSTIEISLANNKNSFTRETFRKIEDYLDGIKNESELTSIIDDSRYLILKKYSSEDANVEEVARAFWTTPSSPPSPAGLQKKVTVQAPPGGQEMPLRAASGRIKPEIMEGAGAIGSIFLVALILTIALVTPVVWSDWFPSLPALPDLWIVSIWGGALVVGIWAWSRFDEPSFDSSSEYFARYKPRFWSYVRYRRVKWGYVGTMISLYFVFSLIPEYFNAFGTMIVQSSFLPVATALSMITLQNVPGVKDLERRIRGFFQESARIPLLRTLTQLRGSQFNFDSDAIKSQTRKIAIQIDYGGQNEGTLEKLIMDDDILHGWYSIGCVLFALSEQSRSRIGIDPLFFEYYKDELDSINACHVAIADPVRQHLAARFSINTSSQHSTASDQDDAAASRGIRDLRDRLYAFVACGVNASVKTDADSFKILGRLGFTFDHSLGKVAISPLIGLLLIALVILSIFTAYSTQLFYVSVLQPLGPEWIRAFPIPTEKIATFLWLWSTAAVYMAAIMGALCVRGARVAKRQWFDINNLERDRPLLRYVTPTLIGTAFGCATLFIIALGQGPGFETSFKSVGEVMHLSLPWFPLAMVMACIALVLSDTNWRGDRLGWRKMFVRGISGGLAMALVGLVTSYIVIPEAVVNLAEQRSLVPNTRVHQASIYVSLFIAIQIGLTASILCVGVQVSEFSTARTPSLAGKDVQAVAPQGPVFSMFFDPAGSVSLFSANASEVSRAHPLCQGRWQQFPEGTVVKWTARDYGHCKTGDLGLISACGDLLIYEGYMEQFSGPAEFTAQIRLRA